MEKEKGFMNGSVPSWNPSSFGVGMKSNELNCLSEEIPNYFFNPNWENSMDQSDPFESALTSIVSSPVTVTTNAANAINPAWAGDGEPLLIRELIGRLGNICNSREISPSNSYMKNNKNNNNSTNASCYCTPLNSPPKLSILGNHSPFATDPGFVERAARFSPFSSLNGQFGFNESELANGSITPQLRSQPGKEKSSYEKRVAENAEIGDCRENSSVSEQIPGGELSKKVEQNDSNSRKRKAITRGKTKETPSSASQTKISAEKDESKAKRSKSDEEANGEEEENGNQNQEQNKEKENSKAAEPTKDYIHVRARRGQATDSHSLAERVRREKISERMKFLQDLVPGCNKVTGKAVMLDEIINYVQSLQRQVEFLSMKLATVNPRMDVNMEALLSSSKDVFQGRGTLAHSVYQLPYNYQSQQGISSDAETHFSINPLNAFDGFADSTAAPLVSAFWEDDLQSIVQMGFGQNQQQGFHAGSIPGTHMKVEL